MLGLQNSDRFFLFQPCVLKMQSFIRWHGFVFHHQPTSFMVLSLLVFWLQKPSITTHSSLYLWYICVCVCVLLLDREEIQKLEHQIRSRRSNCTKDKVGSFIWSYVQYLLLVLYCLGAVSRCCRAMVNRTTWQRARVCWASPQSCARLCPGY